MLFKKCSEILCAQLLLHPLMDFVHTHTQWPTWHEDDRSDWILPHCKFYMSYAGLSTQSETQESLGLNFQESKWDFQESWSNWNIGIP